MILCSRKSFFEGRYILSKKLLYLQHSIIFCMSYMPLSVRAMTYFKI